MCTYEKIEAIEAFTKYFGAKPTDPKFEKFAEYWDAQFKIFYHGFSAGKKVCMPCKPGKKPPKK